MSAQSRNGMITVRLTAEEYRRFRELCLSLGVRSFSEMARAALNMLLQEPGRAPKQTLESRVAEFEACLRMFIGESRNLNRDTARTPASGPGFGT
jgi:hypothetical protein